MGRRRGRGIDNAEARDDPENGLRKMDMPWIDFFLVLSVDKTNIAYKQI